MKCDVDNANKAVCLWMKKRSHSFFISAQVLDNENVNVKESMCVHLSPKPYMKSVRQGPYPN